MVFLFWEVEENLAFKNKVLKLLNLVEAQVNLKKEPLKVIMATGKTISQHNLLRGKKGETDVLSFREADQNIQELKEKSLGEIYINYDWILDNQKLANLCDKILWKESKKDKKTLVILSLFLHGLLHLLGYDHETDKGEMEKLEKKLQTKIIDLI